jgi:hypothetical protein
MVQINREMEEREREKEREREQISLFDCRTTSPSNYLLLISTWFNLLISQK